MATLFAFLNDPNSIKQESVSSLDPPLFPSEVYNDSQNDPDDGWYDIPEDNVPMDSRKTKRSHRSKHAMEKEAQYSHWLALLPKLEDVYLQYIAYTEDGRRLAPAHVDTKCACARDQMIQ